jgi:hypothetical protein
MRAVGWPHAQAPSRIRLLGSLPNYITRLLNSERGRSGVFFE